MKKLFLSSVAYLTLDKIIPLLPASPDKLHLAFIPTASDLSTDKSHVYKDRDKLVDMGFKVKDIDLKDKKKKDLQIELKDIDVVFVSGGNTFYLLEKVKASGFGEIIKEMVNKDVVYIGSSAGSVLVCPTIGFVEGMDDSSAAPSLNSFDGLGIVDFLVLPHLGDKEYKEIFPKIVEKWKNNGYELKLLTNNQALRIDEDSLTVVEA